MKRPAPSEKHLPPSIAIYGYPSLDEVLNILKHGSKVTPWSFAQNE